MIKVNYEKIPEMKISMNLEWNGNAQKTTIYMTAKAQPFEIMMEQQETISFTVNWERELDEIIEWLKVCRDSCNEIWSKQINCAK